ncbi:D-alanyl-D-alanine carboxypeptidase family protein [Coxiella burnetii]|uniref:D-alanyl-D-alanine carboxypeptidase family protein n=1 Tax=Coxiella burnetii TaxID=777 RepID=UPI000183CDA7|nr:D-alanyl-D-alanine carboxypeptidase family protein [Coxiella burnetii]ACJ18148.1 D-alanyl-D-alanine serine-type carboxypeptidase [Coxiella burnetii CbuG_Q212]ATN66542.1 D-alanyl-D-alanine carboxypeptidase [Coxiella burnetii]OYK86455.1 D-alanyl-D-alanine carboxypeptidase [Coxiella burnetii]
MKFLHSRLSAVFLATILLFSVGFSVSALGDVENAAQQNLALAKAATQQQPETPPSLVPPPPNLDVKGYVLMDADSGIVIAQKNMTQRLQPASLTKLMTLYVTFQALKSAQIHLDDKAKVSIKAWRTGGSRMFLKEGAEVPVNLLIQGIIVASGNDACVTMAQYIGGTEPSFAQMMNQTAARLGMKNSHYVDSTGLPRPDHYSTPYDMAVLTRAIINDFPEYYHYFSQKWLTYNNIKQPNRNRLLWRDGSADGLKTGHTEEAGYCLIASAKRNNMRLISVVMGAPTDSERADDSEALLNYGFRFYQTRQLFDANTSITKKRIWMGKRKHAEFGLTQPLYVTLPVGEDKNLKATMSFAIQHLQAPILKGQSYGEINVILNGKPIKKVPLIALQDDPRAGLFSRAWDHLALFFEGIFSKSS